VSVQLDQAYGSHDRQRLDIYTSSERSPQPVLVWVHGGGFIRGSKQHRANIGYWGAREGFLTVLPNYRLAPESMWPSGPEDIVAVWRWLREHAARFGGDPLRIVIAGESAGATHVAAAGLMRRFQPADWNVEGIVLLSGPYNAQLDGLARAQFGIATPDPRNDAYYGADPDRWPAASIVDGIDVEPFPVLIAFAERDMLQMKVHASELFARLVCQHGFVPELHVLREHNHFSGGYSIGTEDTSVSALLMRFLRSTVQLTGAARRPDGS
jgi:acetyl esterase/lipase